MKKKEIKTKKLNSFLSADKLNKTVLKQYILIFALWAIITFVLIILFSIYVYEMTKINNTIVEYKGEGAIPTWWVANKSVSYWKENMYLFGATEQQLIYKSMVSSVFGNASSLETAAQMPLIWFSNMLFIPSFGTTTNWQAAWDKKMVAISTCQVYMLLATIIAIAGLIIYIYLISSYCIKLKITHKKGFTNKYPLFNNDLGVYTTKTYVNFFIAISIFFTFYSLSATLVMLIYMLIIKKIYKEIEKKNDNLNVNIFNTSDLSYFLMLFILMAVMIIYNGSTSFFMYWLSVDISTVLDGLFTTGGIAVVIIGLVKNLLDSSITQIKKKMDDIDNQISQIGFFYKIKGFEASNDYSYVQILPPVITNYVKTNKKIDLKVLQERFEKLFEYTDYIKEIDMGKSKLNKRRKNFILYRMYNEIKTFDEIEDIKINLNKEFVK